MIYHGGQRWEQFLDGEFDGGGEFAGRKFEGFAGPVGLTLGQHFNHHGANTYYRGDLAEVLIFNRVLGEGEQREVGRRLAEEYGLTSRYNTEVLGPTGLITEDDRKHWAWQPLRHPSVPETRGEVNTPVD
ncbi:MAG: LamG domain-containing protein, partial [Akkermansiaceae bacterium]|nr:LamG domain-containing protein [Akkermansiaceae bacterium]